METKHPIQFSWGQFILLLALGLVLMTLVFLLGARFGNSIFPQQTLLPVGDPLLQVAQNVPVAAPETLPEEEALPAQPAGEPEEVPEPEAQPSTESEPDPEIPAQAPEAEGQQEALARPPPEAMMRGTRLVSPPEEAPRGWIPTGAPGTVVRFKSSSASNFSVEAGAFYDETQASQQISELKRKGYEAYLVIQNQRAATPLYLVRVGLFADRQMAESFAAELSNEQKTEMRVVQVN